MKATIEFNLPEEDDEFQGVINAARYRSVVCDFDGWLRSRIKHGQLTVDALEEADTIRVAMHKAFTEEGIEI